MLQGNSKAAVNNPFIRKPGVNASSKLLDQLPSKPAAFQLRPASATKQHKTSFNCENESQNSDANRSSDSMASAVHSRIQILKKDSNSRKKAKATAHAVDPTIAAQQMQQAQAVSIGGDVLVSMRKAKEKVEAMNQRFQLLQTVLKCLQPLYEAIKNNNLSIKREILAKLERIDQIRFNKGQLARLMQGLHFYRPTRTPGIATLDHFFQQHPLAEQLRDVSAAFKLDILKSYYIIKEVYEHKLAYKVRGFSFSPKQGDTIPRRELLDLARQFLQADKKHLIECYLMMLGGQSRPSMKRVCNLYEELNLLWGCISTMQEQEPELQAMIFNLYMKYSSLSEQPRKYSSIEPKQPVFLQKQLFLMKKKMCRMSLDTSIKAQLQQMSVQEMLDQGQLRPEECTGHYQDLIHFLTSKQDINYQQAISRLPASEKLSFKWLPHLKQRIGALAFGRDRHLNFLKTIYIYKILMSFSNNPEGLSESSQKSLIRAVYTISPVFAVKFLEAVRSSSVKVWFIKTLAQCIHEQLKESDPKIISTFAKFLPEFDLNNFSREIVRTTSKAINKCLQENDFTVLETQISSGRSLLFEFNGDSSVFEVVKFYNKLLFKIPSEHQQIQSDVISLFAKLKQLNLNISASFSSYNRSLIHITSNSNIIARHLCFAIHLLPSVDQIAKFASQWLQLIIHKSLHYYFDIFADFFVSFAQRITEKSNNFQAVDVFVEGIRIFQHSIFFYLFPNNSSVVTSNQVKIVRVLEGIKEYCELNQRSPAQDYQQFLDEIKQRMAAKFSSCLIILSSSDGSLQMSEKLMLFHILTKVSRQKESFSCKSKLLQLMQREKSFNMVDLLPQISSQLKQESSFDAIDVLESIIQADSTLAKLIIKQNGTIIDGLLLKSQKFSFLEANKLLQIVTHLYSFFSDQRTHEEKGWLEVIIRTIQLQLTRWLKEADVTPETFSRIFSFLSKAMNGLSYHQHIMFLSDGKSKSLIDCLERTQSEKLSTYGFYLLCMMLSLKKSSIKVHDPRDISQLKLQLTIFTDIAIGIVKYYASLETVVDFSEFSTKYINKLYKIYLQCQSQTILSVFVKKQLSRLGAAMNDYKSKFAGNSFLNNQAALISDNIKQQVTQTALQLSSEEVQVRACRDFNDFNNVYIRNVRLIESQTKLERIPYLLRRQATFMKLNSKMKVKYIGFNKTVSARLLKNNTTVLLFLTFLQHTMNMLHYQTARSSINSKFIQDIVKQSAIYLQESRSFQQIVINSLTLATVRTALENSLLSRFLAHKILGSSITALLESLGSYLWKWEYQEGKICSTITGRQINLEWYPKSLRNCFSLWSLLQFRQKLVLLSELFRYCRQLNGINDLKRYSLVETVMDYLKLFKNNQRLMRSNYFSKQVEILNDFLSQNHPEISNPLNFITKSLSFYQLRSLCADIGQNLNQLGCDFTEDQVQFFSDFQIQLTS